MVFKKDFLHSKKNFLKISQLFLFPFKNLSNVNCLKEILLKKKTNMHSTSVIPLAQESNSSFRKKKFQKKKNTSHRSHNNVKMKMDALITLDLTLVKADG